MVHYECSHCATGAKFNHAALIKHYFKAHFDIIQNDLIKRYKGQRRPREHEGLIATINNNDYYVCLCCCGMWQSEILFAKHHKKSVKCDYGSQIIKLNETIGENFAAPDIRRDPKIVTLEAFAANQTVWRTKVDKQIKELLAANKVLTEEIQNLKRRPASYPTIKRPEPANEITEPAPAAVLEKALLADQSENAENDTVSEPNKDHEPKITTIISQIPLASNIVCIDCGYLGANEPCAGCQAPICMPQCPNGDYRPMCEGPCDSSYCAKCAPNKLNDDDLCRTCAKNQ